MGDDKSAGLGTHTQRGQHFFAQESQAFLGGQSMRCANSDGGRTFGKDGGSMFGNLVGRARKGEAIKQIVGDQRSRFVIGIAVGSGADACE